MKRHPQYPWMRADLDYLVNLPDSAAAILESLQRLMGPSRKDASPQAVQVFR